MPDWLIEPLRSDHDRRGFSCGKASLDTFLQNLVNQYEKRKLGRTYVAIRHGENRVLGYYTLACASVRFQDLPLNKGKKLPKHPVPTALLARLAVDQAVRGQGLGKVLLIDALHRCLGLSSQLGLHAVEVDAMDDEARAFYEKFGFAALLDSPLHLFLPVATIAKIFP